MAFTGTALRTAKLDLTLLGCESLITCSPLVRLGDKDQTIISARISNGDPDLDLTGWVMGFEATVGEKLIRDEDQSRFRLVGKNTVEYKCSDEVHSFIGTANVAYFTLKKDGTTVTTQNFTIHSLSNAETGTTGLKEHYVSVIDDLVKSNGEVMGKAEEIKNLIEKNQVVKKSGDTMTGTLTSGSVYPMDFKGAKGQPNWTLRHLSSDGSLVFAPSKTPEGTDWDWTKQIVFHPVNGLQIFGGTNLYKKTDLYPNWVTSNGGSTQLATKTDLNTVTKSGLYSGYDLVNTPDAINQFFYVEVIPHYNDRYLLQRATTLSGSTLATWQRRLDNSVWGAWIKQIDANGGTLTGELKISKIVRYQNREDKSVAAISVDNLGRWYNWSDVSGKRVFMYDPTTDTFTVDSANTNFVKNTGGVISGELTMRGALARLVFDVAAQSVTFDQPTTQISARGLLYREDGVTTGGIGRLRDTSGSYSYMGWGASPWDMSTALVVNDKVFKYKNKDVAMRDKDDRATIPVTADAELITSYGVIADRRGNTVTLRAPIRRKVGSTNGHVFTLPADMRPTMMLTQVVHASDGTPALMTIPSDTGQVLLQTITPAIMGKDYHIVLTYVAD